MNATHDELEKGINEAINTLGRLAYDEPCKLTGAEAWALGVLTGSAQRLLRELELPSRGQGECCFHQMDIGGNRMDCPAKHREDNAEVIYLRKLLHDTADKMRAAEEERDLLKRAMQKLVEIAALPLETLVNSDEEQPIPDIAPLLRAMLRAAREAMRAAVKALSGR